MFKMNKEKQNYNKDRQMDRRANSQTDNHRGSASYFM